MGHQEICKVPLIVSCVITLYYIDVFKSVFRPEGVEEILMEVPWTNFGNCSRKMINCVSIVTSLSNWVLQNKWYLKLLDHYRFLKCCCIKFRWENVMLKVTVRLRIEVCKWDQKCWVHVLINDIYLQNMRKLNP